MLKMYSVTVRVLLSNYFVKLGTELLISPAENCPIFSNATCKSETVWASDEGFKIASCVACQTQYLHSELPSWTVVAYVRRRLMTSSSRQPDCLPSAIVPLRLPAVDSGTVYHLTLHLHKLCLSSVTV